MDGNIALAFALLALSLLRIVRSAMSEYRRTGEIIHAFSTLFFGACVLYLLALAADHAGWISPRLTALF